MKNSQRQNNSDNDKLSSGPAYTGDFATSTSSNITVASAGAFDNPHTIIPGTEITKKKEVED